MPETQIDLRTAVIPPNKKIWRLFPGKTYRFLQEFKNNQVVFLDFPGLVLPNDFYFEDKLLTDAIVLAGLARRDWVAAMVKANRLGKELPVEPPRNPVSYFEQTLPKKALSDRAALIALFRSAQKNDLVVVPDRIPSRQILVGEFLDEPEIRTVATAPDFYGSEPIPARPVRWFPVVNEVDLSRELSDVLRRPNPFTLLGRNFYPQIFDETYGTYRFGEAQAARLLTSGPDFTGDDNLDLSLLIKAVTVLSYSAEHGRRRFETLSEVLDVQLTSDFAMSLGINVHSPGAFHLKSASALPLVFTALFALMVSAEGAEQPRPQDIKVVNTSERASDDPCAVEIDERVRTVVSLMGFDLWKSFCERAKRLAQNPQMQGTGRARRSPR
ncbi:hypothetical protein ACFQS7_14645 [Dankookia sp. GCM10030260]|uniref:hypothetical protein n=1 Tax=Dankookia sp. GCM10030260 TaxID=3273390 RepID=UPI00362065A7